jgi:hypothetical protein
MTQKPPSKAEAAAFMAHRKPKTGGFLHSEPRCRAKKPGLSFSEHDLLLKKREGSSSEARTFRLFARKSKLCISKVEVFFENVRAFSQKFQAQGLNVEAPLLGLSSSEGELSPKMLERSSSGTKHSS